MRWAEILLLLAPAALFLIWHRAALRGEPGPSRTMLALGSAGLLVFGVGLAWFGVHQHLPQGSRYVPAHSEHGTIIQGHGE